MQNKGFTLIELLVVVLIIGILTGLALPQYQKAVWKAEAVEAQTYAESFIKGQQLYQLANGKFLTDSPTKSHFEDVFDGMPDTEKVEQHFNVLYAGGLHYVTLFLSHKKNPQYTLYVSLETTNDGTKVVIYRKCVSHERACKAISNGAVCTNFGGPGDVPWCFRAS